MTFYTKYFEDVSNLNINDYNDFMLNDIEYNKIKLKKMDKLNTSIIIEKREEFIGDVTYPNREDSLFWCIFIYINGTLEYEKIQRSYHNIIISEKQKIGNYFSKNFRIMKDLNIKLTHKEIQQIISDIMINNEVNIDMLYAFSIYFKLRIYILKPDKELYIDIKPDNEDNFVVLVKKGKEYGIDLDKLLYQKLYRYFKLEKYNKPLKGISYYNMGDLRELGDKLEIPNIENIKNKQDLYREIYIYCSDF